jgi:hypothetical protein
VGYVTVGDCMRKRNKIGKQYSKQASNETLKERNKQRKKKFGNSSMNMLLKLYIHGSHNK